MEQDKGNQEVTEMKSSEGEETTDFHWKRFRKIQCSMINMILSSLNVPYRAGYKCFYLQASWSVLA